jgi:hypothetical protein
VQGKVREESRGPSLRAIETLFVIWLLEKALKANTQDKEDQGLSK